MTYYAHHDRIWHDEDCCDVAAVCCGDITKILLYFITSSIAAQ